MTDIGSCRPPPGGMRITGGDGTALLVTATPASSASVHSGSTSLIQPNINGISNYSYTTAVSSASVTGASSSPGSDVKISGSTSEQQGKQKAAFIVLPISFRDAADGTEEMPQSQIQQTVSSPGAAVHLNSVGSTTSVASTKGNSHQAVDSSAQIRQLQADQAVASAVNWIVRDAKQRQRNQYRPPVQHTQQQQQLHRRTNGKLPEPCLPSPTAAAPKCATENVRKFSTSAVKQQETRYFTYDVPMTVSHSEPNTPHGNYSPSDGVVTSKVGPASQSVVPDTGLVKYAVPADQVNGSASPSDGTDDMAVVVSSGPEGWSAPHSNRGVMEGLRRTDSTVGRFLTDGVCHQADLALSTPNSFVGSATGPDSLPTSRENGNPPHHIAAAVSSSMLISPTASTISDAPSSGTPPVNTGDDRSAKLKSGGSAKSGKGSSGGGTFCAYEERQCKQRCINGYRHCIRHILCDPNSPYRPCNYVKKQGAKEIRCSNAVSLSQGTEYCSTHLIMMGMKEAKRRKVPAPNAPAAQSGDRTMPKTEVNGLSEKSSPAMGEGAKKKKVSKKSQPSKPQEPVVTPNLHASSNLYDHSGHGNDRGQFDSTSVQYHQHQDQRMYAAQYGRQQASTEQQPRPFVNSGEEDSARGMCSELPSTSTPANNGVAFCGNDYGQQHESQRQQQQQQQHVQPADNCHRPYFINQQQFELGYQDSTPYPQQMCYQPLPQPAYVPQPQQHDYVIQQQSQQPAPAYICAQPDNTPVQMVYENHPQSHEGNLYTHPYSTTAVHQQRLQPELPPLQQQQHRQEQGDHAYDQMSMPPPQSALSAAGVNSAIAGSNQTYGTDYVMEAPACTSSSDQNNGNVWRMSPLGYNQPLSNSQIAGPGSVFVLYQNGTSASSTDLARTHPELAAHLLHSSGSSGESPPSRGLSSAGSGNGSIGSFPLHSSNHHQQLLRSSFQPPQQAAENFDDSVQGFTAAARGDASYLLSSDDPFLGAPSSSGYSRDGNGNNSNIGAAGLGVAVLSPESSEMSESSPRSFAVHAANTATNAGVGLCPLPGQHHGKQTVPTYLYQPGAAPPRFLYDYQSKPGPVQPRAGEVTYEQRRILSSAGVDAGAPAPIVLDRPDGQSVPPAGSAGPVATSQSCAPQTNKKVIRLKQKKRHSRMGGAYRQIPAVGHMCKILEDLDHYRKDLFPLGLEPSSSDTDSDDESSADLHHSLLVAPARALVARKALTRDEKGALANGDQGEIAGSLLSPGVVSKAKRQLYLLKKTLRLDENRLRRRVTTESRVIASASRLYPNSVGAALGDRRRHRTGLRRRLLRYSQQPLSNDSRKPCSGANGGKKATSKLKKYPANAVETEGNADLELKRSLATRRCTFETPATLVLVQHTGPNGNVEHRRQVLAQHRCGNRSLPYCKYCLAHVLHNEDQQLYRKCAYSECHRAALDACPDLVPSCPVHRSRRGFQPMDATKLAAEGYIAQEQEHLQRPEQQADKPAGKGKKVQQREDHALPPASGEADNAPGAKRKKKKANAKVGGQDSVDAGSKIVQNHVIAIREQSESKRAARASSSSATKDDETTAVAQEALTLASVAHDFGFEDNELTEMLIRLPEEAFDGILEPDLARTGPGVITITDSGGGNDLLAVNPSAVQSSSAHGVDAVEMAVQAATSSCSHNWADVEQFLLSEGYCASGAAPAPGTTAGPAIVFSSPPLAYTNLTNAPANLDHASSVPFHHPQPAPISTAGGWPTPLAPIAPVESYIGQQSAVMLPSIDVYAASTVTTTPVSSVHEQSAEQKLAVTSSWSK